MKKPFLLIIILLFIFLSDFAQGIKLAVNLPVGYRYTTETTLNLTVEQEFMGIRYNTQMDINSLLEIMVMEINADSNYLLKASYKRMDIRVTSLLINMEVSTESIISGDSLSGLLRAIRGKEFSIKLSRKGEMLDITGLDEMISETVLSGNTDDMEKVEFNRNLVQSLGREALLNNYRSISSFYPDFPVKNHDQWDYHVNIVKSGIPMELSSIVRVKDVTRETVILASEGRINSQKNKGELLPADPAIPVYYLAGYEISENKIDIKTGLLTESIVSQNITGTIKTPASEENVEEMMIPFKIISRISMATVPLGEQGQAE